MLDGKAYAANKKGMVGGTRTIIRTHRGQRRFAAVLFVLAVVEVVVGA